MIKKIALLIIAMMSLVLVGCMSVDDETIHTVSFMSEGTLIFTEQAENEKTFLPSQKLTKSGFIFGGWYLDAEFLYPMAFNAGVTEDVTLYAKWIENDSEIDDAWLTEWLTLNSEFLNTLIDIEQTGYSANDLIEMIANAQEAMINLANQSVVKIDIVSGTYEGSGGSGVIYQKIGNTYYVLTNHHVTEGSASATFEITVFNQNGSKSYANITKVHELVTQDLAILKFTTTDSLSVIPLAESSGIVKGQTVFAIGSPVWFDDIVTQGVVSYEKLNDEDGEGFDAFVIMHTSPINPGNSGGALINIYGELIGINAYSYPTYDTENDLQMYNFAIHIDEVKAYILNKV